MSDAQLSQDFKKQKTDDTFDDTNNTLGIDQWKWLNHYKSINLRQWRMYLLKEHSSRPDWYYVGNWEPNGCIKPYDEDPNADGGYMERRRNLKRDKYFYWPSGSK